MNEGKLKSMKKVLTKGVILMVMVKTLEIGYMLKTIVVLCGRF